MLDKFAVVARETEEASERLKRLGLRPCQHCLDFIGVYRNTIPVDNMAQIVHPLLSKTAFILPHIQVVSPQKLKNSR